MSEIDSHDASISHVEMVRLRRRARFYRYRILRLIYLAVAISLVALLYLYRKPLTIITQEIGNSYIFVGHVAVNLCDRLSGLLSSGINTVEIKGISRVQKQEIVEQIYIKEVSGNVRLHNSMHVMKNNIMKIPFVKNVVITRDLARGKIIIRVVEKNIIGLVKRNFCTDILMLDDECGLQHANEAISRLSDVPIVENIEYSDAYLMLYLYLHEKSIFTKLGRAVFVSNRRWDLYFRNNLLVKLPAKNWQEAIDLLIRVDQKINVLSDFNKIEYIDLRAHGKIFLK